MNRRGFVCGLLAGAMAAAARIYAPSTLSATKVSSGFKTYTAPENVPSFPPLRGRAVQSAGYVYLPYVPHERPR